MFTKVSPTHSLHSCDVAIELHDSLDRMSVSVKFTFKGREESIVVSRAESSNINEISAEAKESNTSFEYSGRHDHGMLPTLKSEGHMAQLVGSLEEAKKECDKVLTALIETEKRETDGPSEKKPRLEGEENK